MQYIDAFTHFFPSPFALRQRMLDDEGNAKNIGARMRGISAIYDLDTRFRIMDEFDDYSQVISLGMPPLETLGPNAPDFEKLGNDCMT